MAHNMQVEPYPLSFTIRNPEFQNGLGKWEMPLGEPLSGMQDEQAVSDVRIA